MWWCSFPQNHQRSRLALFSSSQSSHWSPRSRGQSGWFHLMQNGLKEHSVKMNRHKTQFVCVNERHTLSRCKHTHAHTVLLLQQFDSFARKWNRYISLMRNVNVAICAAINTPTCMHTKHPDSYNLCLIFPVSATVTRVVMLNISWFCFYGCAVVLHPRTGWNRPRWFHCKSFDS